MADNPAVTLTNEVPLPPKEEKKEVVKKPLRMEVVEQPYQQPTHEHQWDLILKNYAAPRPDLFQTEGLDPDTAEKLLFGVTILLWKCVLCSETKKEEVIGTDENQLDEMIGKVIIYGPQYLQKDGVTYVIARWQPTTPSTNNLPLR